MSKNFLEELNEAQRIAVETIDGPVMIIAGAGSGKTRALTYRIAYLLSKGVDPFNILSLTFTNKAAKEMKERVHELVGSTDARNVWMGTFHSVFARILRQEAEKLGYPSNFSIYDTDDTKSLMKNIIKEQNLDPKQYVPNHILHRISSAKSSLLSANDYNSNPELIQQDKMANKPLIGQLFTLYNLRLRKASAMDFDDLLFNTNVLLRDFPEVLFKYQHKFRYILVDEYQDTNYAQYLIVKKLAANNENICVVGDDAQSIYAFRGANIQNILNFKSDYPDLKTFKLEQNYRSTKTIVNAANSLIAKNKDQIFKEIWTDNDEGQKIKLLKAASDNEEGTLVANAIFESKQNNQLQNNAFAILYRTNAQSRAMEEALRKLNIPYRIYGGLSFYKRKEIKDLLAYFRLVINLNDEEAMLRIINFPTRGIGQTTIDRIRIAADTNNMSIWQIMDALDHITIDVNQGTKAKIADFVAKIKSYHILLKTKNAYELAKNIAISSGIMKALNDDDTPEGVSRIENIEELLNAIKDFSESTDDLVSTDPELAENNNEIRSLEAFMQDIALLTDADNDGEDDNNKVSMMTIHAAKGLEFPYVFVVGLEENLFPSIMSISSRADLEEERRLFYVAITRAEIKLTLSYAEMRYRWGDLSFCEPSRFIEEIDVKYLDFPQKNPTIAKFKGDNNFLSNEPKIGIPFDKNKFKKVNYPNNSGENFNPSAMEEIDGLQIGMEVEHDRFGMGRIINLEGSGPNKKATVNFQNIGNKQLLLKFAKLKIIN
ncbi:MAG: UvrD-helicase domain-containing protein [Bacteroidetes bacterium]|nr:UvrD-helicase domain-containing protein [Bacteroidota bacterium]